MPSRYPSGGRAPRGVSRRLEAAPAWGRPQPSARVVVPNSGKIDRLILLTSESSLHPVDFDDRTKMLHNANRRVPTHARVVDPHDAVTVRTVVDPLLKGGCHDCSFSVVLITT